MRFLENVRTEYTLPVEGGEDRHFVIDLRAIVGDHIEGNAIFDIPTRYPYSLSIEEHVKTTSLRDVYTHIPVVSGVAYISLNEIKEVKKDPYKFCIENGIIESDEETEDTDTEKVEEMETENRVSKKDEMLLKEIQQLVDGFENKRFAIASLLATTIDIGCGVGEKEGEKKCANCPLTSYTCREISNRAKMLLSDTCDEQTANEGNE